jgi:predicted nucleotidyltransferase
MDINLLTTATNILKNAGCTNVYLFGSQVRGIANDNSDIDLGVKGLKPSLFFRVHLQLENALNMKVDLVDFDYQRSFFELLQDIGELKQIG